MAEEAQKLYSLLKADKNCKSLLAKNLTQERFDQLKDKKTKFGGTLADCIRSGKNVVSSGVLFFPVTKSIIWTSWVQFLFSDLAFSRLKFLFLVTCFILNVTRTFPGAIDPL